MRNPLFSLPTYRLTSGLFIATSLVVSCGDTETKKSPVRDLPGVILLDTGDDGNNVPLEDDSPPPGFSSYGFWYTYHDIGACEDTNTPNPDMEAEMFPEQGSIFTTTPYAQLGIQPPPETLPNAPDNTHGIRFSGGGQEYFGAGLGFKLENAYVQANNQGMDFLAAGIVGFRFWAYSSIDSDYIFKVQDLYSTPEAGKCVPRGPFPGCEGPQNCENAPATGNSVPDTTPVFSVPNIEVGPTWKLFHVYLTQQVADDPNTPAVELGPLLRSNWDGVDTSVPPRDIKELPAEPAHIFQLQFQTAAAPGETGQFDLWIDNFGFILAGG